MSGGSHDYLCYKQADELLNMTRQLRSMAEDLLQYKEGKEAAVMTEQLANYIDVVTMRIDAKARILADVWGAVEWHHSGDSGSDRVDATLRVLYGAEA